LEWIPNEVVHSVIKKHAPQAIVNERAPKWLINTVATYMAASIFMPDLDLPDMISKVGDDENLQHAIDGASRIGAKSFEIAILIKDWPKP
jgi:hypothetical protein